MAEAALSRSSSVKPTEAPDGRKLPSWHDSNCGVPNILLRSALFSSSRSSQDLVQEEIFAQSPTRIRYAGPQLNQADHDVWITLLHLARRHRLNLPIRTSAYSLLKRQHKTDTGANRKNLYKCLARLERSKVEIIDFRCSYTDSLVTRPTETSRLKSWSWPATQCYVFFLMRRVLLGSTGASTDYSTVSP